MDCDILSILNLSCCRPGSESISALECCHAGGAGQGGVLAALFCRCCNWCGGGRDSFRCDLFGRQNVMPAFPLLL